MHCGSLWAVNLNMIAIYYRFLEIATWGKGPEDIPRSTTLLAISMTTYVVSAFLLLLVAHRIQEVFLALAVDLLMMTVWLWTLLTIRGFSERLIQTLTTFLGTGTIIHLVFIPPASTLGQFDEPSFPSLIASLAIFVTLIWHVMIHAHILHRALNIHRSVGVMLAFMYLVMDITVQRMLPGFPVEAVS